jgi:2-oxoisovalerate dehydrogenase E1 component alpha subunit
MSGASKPSIVAQFTIPFQSYVDEDGTPAATLPTFAQSKDELIAMYRAMVRTRIFDEKAVALQRTGRLGTFASSLGQEAVGVGVASAMLAEDVLLPSFREQSAMLWRGVTMAELLAYWGGDERGSDFSGPREDFPICIPVATHFPHAVGVATAFAIRREPRVAVAIAGDGATSKGDFYEALNFAGVWRLPVVFVISNNQWAISVPRSAQSAAATLAQKGIAAGIGCEQVDGNDVVAVRDAATQALKRARSGGGATLIEALTYRLSDHTTADDATRYRTDEEVSQHWRGEPIGRLRTLLTNQHGWTREMERELLEACRRDVDDAAVIYLATPPAPPTDMIDYLYDELPASLTSLRAILTGHDGGDRG